MLDRGYIAPQTSRNWLVDAGLFIGALIASITGIYFLFLPVGGYQGGRNLMYGVQILFERETWENLHTWFGIWMIVAAVIHIILHWKWFVSMAKRIFSEITQRKTRFNPRSRYNLLINLGVGLGFILAAISGIYMFFVPGGKYGIPDPMIIFTRTTWDFIHTWSGIVMIVAAVIHFWIHWKWVTKVTRKICKSMFSVFWKRQPRKSISS
jgi:hypothetical protein